MTTWTTRLAVFTALFAFAPAAHALIITTGNGQVNTTAPLDDPGFANVGSGGVGTVVYLGNRMVLTAYHVGGSFDSNLTPVNFGGTSYTPVPGSGVRLQNPNSSLTDLVVFQIDTDPGLPALNIASAAPANGTAVTMIGNGLSRSTSPTYWDVDTSVPGNWVWNEVAVTDPWDVSGYKWGGTPDVRWATNVIASNDFDFTVPAGPVQGMLTIFNDLADEGQAASGDSGGAIFAKNGSNEWELAGIMIAVSYPSSWNNVPSGASFLGASATLAADLSAYQSQINALVPEPSSWLLLAVGLSALAWHRRRVRQRPRN